MTARRRRIELCALALAAAVLIAFFAGTVNLSHRCWGPNAADCREAGL
jgi:hypothetical protein